MDDKQWPIDQRICDYCGRRGHVKRKCYKLKDDTRGPVHHIDTQEAATGANSLAERLDRLRTRDWDSDDDDSGDVQCMHVVSINKISDPCLLTVFIENQPVQLEIDSGSSVSVMGKDLFFCEVQLSFKKKSKSTGCDQWFQVKSFW